MKAHCIVIENNDVSELGYRNLIASSFSVGNEFEINRYDAVTGDQAQGKLAEWNLRWNYPWEGSELDIATGLLKNAYRTKDRNKRIACSLSHYGLWLRCFNEQETFLIFEHDAIFKEKLASWVTEASSYDIIGINDPRGATRKSKEFYDIVRSREALIQRAPKIDNDQIPQGIAGNSAYVLKPSGAEKLLNLVKEYGLWPNDAIMCRQLVRTLAVTKVFFTGVQGLPSTTTE